MKRFVIAVATLLLLLMFVGCSNEAIANAEDDIVEVSIGFSGEFDSVTQVPLQGRASGSRSLEEGEGETSAKNWYAVQVYDENGSPYAYGFFDNLEDMKLLLVKDFVYSFTVDMIPNAEGKVYKFSLCQSGWAAISNSFYYSKTESVRYLGEGYLYMNYPVYETFNRPAIDRFYGTLTGYTASANGVVNINLKRSSFKVKFVAKDFTEGSLEFSIDNAPVFTLSVSDGSEFEQFYSFNNLSSLSEEIGVTVIWINGDGKRIPLVAQNVTFNRNTLTTLEFTVKATETANNFTINAEEELVEGSTINLDSINDLVDTDVNTTTES